MNDIVARLRKFPTFYRQGTTWICGTDPDPLCREAADTIETLHAALSELVAVTEPLPAMIGPHGATFKMEWPSRLDKARSAASAALAGLPVLSTDSWQPIDSVPMDDRPVLVWLEADYLHSRVHAATYHPNVVCIGGRFQFDVPKATHWMPLPSPPAPLSVEPQGKDYSTGAEEPSASIDTPRSRDEGAR